MEVFLSHVKKFWDWVDERDIDKHATSLVILIGTKIVTDWAMAFSNAHPDKTGMELGAIIASVTAPYMVLQAAAIKFYFDARTK